MENQATIQDDLFSVRDILDSQLETRDDIEISRVADIEAEWRSDGTLVLTSIVTGPQALAGRVWGPLGSFFSLLFKGRFEHRISLQEVEQFGPTLRLRRSAADYQTGQSEKWIANYLLRWIPGSGYR